MKRQKVVLSPFYQPAHLDMFVARIMKHLEVLRLPFDAHLHAEGTECSRDCHIVERNHTLALMEKFIREDINE